MRFFKICCVMTMGLSLSSCGIYKAYERPTAVQAPESYRSDGLLSAESWQDSAHIGLVSWREIFTDPHLQDLIAVGLDSNFDLRNAFLQVRQMRARLVQARLAYTPALNVNASYGISGIAESGTEFFPGTYAAGASASWEIDIFGKILNAKRGAAADFLQSEAGRRSVQTQIIAGIASSYYTLLMLDRQLEISRETLVLWDKSISMMESLKAAGNVNQAAVEQAKANRFAVQASLPDLEMRIRELENSLSLMLGREGGKIERGKFDEQELPEELAAGVPSQLFMHRPDVMQAEAALMSAFAGTAAARAAFLPSFNISANGNWTNAMGSLILDPAKFILQAVASLALPVFNHGTLTANLRVAKARQEIAANTFQKTLLAAANEVSDALFQYQATGTQCEYRAQQVAALENTVAYTTQLLTLGGTYLEVLTAQQALLQAQLSQVSDRYAQMNSVITLYRALGGGAQETVEDVTADNWNKNKSVRKRVRAAEKQL